MTRIYVKRSPSSARTSAPTQRRVSASWLRAQLQGLRFTAALRAIPQTELLKIIDALLAGEPAIPSTEEP